MGCKKLDISKNYESVLTVVGKYPTIENLQIGNFLATKKLCVNYFPFGSSMPGRSFNSSAFRYGYQGSEVVEEIGGDRNHITTYYREADLESAQWWSLDPKPHASWSPYAMMNCNPIWFNDPLGDKIKVGAKDETAKSDIKSLAKNKNQKYVGFGADGDVSLNFGGLKQSKINKILRKDEGLSLVNDLVNAKDASGGDVNFFYGTEGATGIGLENSQAQSGVPNYYSNISSFEGKTLETDRLGGYNAKGFVLNASTQPYSDDGTKFGLVPTDEYDAKVFIGQGTFKGYGKSLQKSNIYDSQGNITGIKREYPYLVVPRSSIIKHELRESLLRTVHGNSYDNAHRNAGAVDVERFYPK